MSEPGAFAGGDPAPAGRVLVTGATGHIGAKLVRALLDDGPARARAGAQPTAVPSPGSGRDA